MKVTKLHIDDYKVFKDFDIDFTDKDGKAQNLIVLAGINGTGKTTLLKFIFNCVHNRSDFDSKIQTPSYVIVDTPLPSEDLYSFTGYYPKGLGNILGGNFFFYHNPEPNYDEFENGILFFRVKKYNLSYSLDPILDNEIIKKYVDHFIYDKELTASEGYQALKEFFDKILYSFSLGLAFRTLESGRRAIFQNQKGDNIPIEDLSTGERQIISLVLQLFVAGIKDSIILIDEPEFSLHPSWQNKIVGVLQKYADEYNCQVILATHSPQIIGSVHPEQLKLLYKDDNGGIKVKEYIRESYGLPFDRVLTEVMGVEQLRTPVIDDAINELRSLISDDQYESPAFFEKMKKMEDTIGYSDKDLILMRFEIAKRKKQGAADSKK